MPPLLERLGVELPVVQAGMGGGLSRHELAVAVSEAGGLGTIAVNGAGAIRRELEEARAAHAAGADGVIVQGVEAGGHVRGTTPALQLLGEARVALPADFPLLL